MSSAEQYRLCPKCTTRRSANELFCEMLIGEVPCGWDLSGLDIYEGDDDAPESLLREAWRSAHYCPNGHAIHDGDLICSECGANIEEMSQPNIAPTDGPPSDASHGEIAAGWVTISPLPATDEVRQRFRVRRTSDGRLGLLTVYRPGSQPDAQVYEALQNRIPREHIVELIEHGERAGQFYDITELIECGSLATTSVPAADCETIRRIVEEVGSALAAFMEVGLRHRTLHPEKILVRSREPLDLVITGFESGRLSDADLETESLLEINRYTAPEAVMGGVTSASDWWGLGMILLGIITEQHCFESANDQLFLIHVQASGVSIPEQIDQRVALLLRGLLTIDRTKRWQWKEVREWLTGGTPPVAEGLQKSAETEDSAAVVLANQRVRDPRRFAIEASRAANWDEACDLLTHGQIGLWAEELNLDASIVSGLRQLGRMAVPDVGLRLGVALQLLNPHLPLIYAEAIVTPTWLLNHPELGYELITSILPDIIEQYDVTADYWLCRLARRAESIRTRAEIHEIELDEGRFRILVLSASHLLLARQWQQRRNELPDASHPSLASLMERDQHSDEDLILLLSASLEQFCSASEIVARANDLAQQVELPAITEEFGREQLQKPRRELYLAVDARIKGFARCGHPRLDAWADHFRMERRLGLPEVLSLLASPVESWLKPQNQEYIASVLGFFEKKVSAISGRGPLVRMTLGKTTPRIDFRELTRDAESAAALLTQLLQRTEKTYALDPRILSDEEGPGRRIRSLLNRTTQYLRDTGINGAYVAFPFVLLRALNSQTKPRLAPILLWPVKIAGEVGSRGSFSLTFDRDRGGVAINPAFEGLYGPEGAARWKAIADDLLSRSSISLAEVVDAFGAMAKPVGRSLVRLPKFETSEQLDGDQIISCAVLFHLEFTGQSLIEDLRQIRQRPVDQTPLGAMLRVGEPVTSSSSAGYALASPRGAEPSELEEQFLVTHSDPSQEEAIAKATKPPGLVVQGPPGTGKSQTIVNMVANSIGHKKHVLIVCQKLPALEVVRKRLVAENLGNRIVMLTNVTSERRLLLQDIRSQLAELQQGDLNAAYRNERNAQQIAAQIHKLEQEIDCHFAANYELDTTSGRTYRQVLAELIQIEDPRSPPVIDIVGLRMLFRGKSASELIDCEEACGSVANEWYAAQYEDSPLGATQIFSHDDATVREFQRALEQFAAAEQEREEIPRPMAHEDFENCPEGLELWLAENEEEFAGWSEESLKAVGSLMPQFRPEGCVEEYVRMLERQVEVVVGSGVLTGLSANVCQWVSQFDAREVDRIAAECARHVNLWLAANFDGSPLEVVRLPSSDPDVMESFRKRLHQFAAAEEFRLESLKAGQSKITVPSPERLEQWLATSEDAVRESVVLIGDWAAKLLPLEDQGGLCSRYEAILEEWFELSAIVPAHAINLPQLEEVFHSSDESLLARLIHECSTVVGLWIKEPLDSLLLSAIARFPKDSAECLEVQETIQRFIDAEWKRDTILMEAPEPRFADNTEDIRQWMNAFDKSLSGASEFAYADATRWRPLFQSVAGRGSKAQEIRERLKELIEQIQRIRHVAVDQRYSTAFSSLDDESFQQLSSLVNRASSTSAGLFGVRRRLVMWELRRWLRHRRLPTAVPDLRSLEGALYEEAERRRVLQEMDNLVQKLALSIHPADSAGIADQAEKITERLVSAFRICQAISKCPDSELKGILSRALSRDDVLQGLAALRKALAVQDAILESRKALKTLQPIMSSTWMEWQSQCIERGRMAAVRREYLGRLSETLTLLGNSAALRSVLGNCAPQVPAILSKMEPVRAWLESLPPEQLSRESSQILRWHVLSARKRGLESNSPHLRELSATHSADKNTLLKKLKAVRLLAPYVAACPIPAEFRKALTSRVLTAVADFLVDCRKGIAQSLAMQAAQDALACLKHDIDAKWIESCRAAIDESCSNRERVAPLIAALPELAAFMMFRALAVQLDPSVRQALMMLTEVRTRLQTIPEDSRPTEVSYAIRISHLAAWQTSLDAREPAFRSLNAMSIEGSIRALELIKAFRRLVQRIDRCPLSTPLRTAIISGSRENVVHVIQGFRTRIQRAKAIERSLQQLSNLRDWMSPEWVAKAQQKIVRSGSNVSDVQSLISATPTAKAYQLFRVRATSLPELHFQVFRLLRGVQSELSTAAKGAGAVDLGRVVRRTIRRESLLSWKMQMEVKFPSLHANRQAMAQKVATLGELDRKLRDLNRERIRSAHLDAIAPINEWEDITRLSGPRARRLREFFDLGRERGLLALRPVWMMTPDVASQVLPLEKSIFDLVIFDEASQMPVEYAIPSLYRAKSAVVSGDEKQMPPSSFFASRIESDESESTNEEALDEFASEQERRIQEQAWNRREVKDCPDLLHLGLAALPQTTLQIHYRSAFRELIGYSNAAFYRNELGVPIRHPDEFVRRNCPIEYIHAGGVYEHQMNREEGHRVVDVLAKIWKEAKNKRPTLGIVTFNLKQAELIGELLEERAEVDEEFRKAYAAELNRNDMGEDMSLFVKNVENVQGDERDYIVFSTTFGRSHAGSFRRSFGVLGQAGGERRLNVAVTRARKKIIIIGSMPVDEISDMVRTRRRPESPRDYLQAYLHYAQLVSSGRLDESRQLVERLAPPPTVSILSGGELDSFKQSVAQFVRDLGHEPIVTSDDPVLGVDFSIRDPRTGEFGIGIECDPPQHRLIRGARAREIWRPTILAGVYRVIHQVSAYAWYHTPDDERNQLRQQIKKTFSYRKTMP